MNIRNTLILFFSAMAVSLVLLIVFFSLFSENIDLSFNAKVPETAPDLGVPLEADRPTHGSRGGGLEVIVPGDSRRATAGKGDATLDKSGDDREGIPAETAAEDEKTPPMVGVSPEGAPMAGLSSPKTSAEASPALPAPTTPKAPVNKVTSEKPTEKKAVTPATTAPLVEIRKPPATAQTTPAKTSPVITKPVTAKPAPSTAAVKPISATSKTAVPMPSGNTAAKYRVYLSGYKSREAAQAQADALKAQGHQPLVRESGGQVTIQLGVFSNKDYAQSLAGRAGATVQEVK